MKSNFSHSNFSRGGNLNSALKGRVNELFKVFYKSKKVCKTPQTPHLLGAVNDLFT